MAKKSPGKKQTAKAAKNVKKVIDNTAKLQKRASDNVTALPFINLETLTMKSNKNFDKLTQDATASVQEQFDAFSQAASIYAKGMEQMMKVCMELSQEAADSLAEKAKNLMACKTINEYAEAQNKFAQASFEEIMGNATKLSELSIRIANDTFQPLNEQMNKAIKKASDNLAA